MNRFMCGVKLDQMKTSEGQRAKLGLLSLRQIMRTMRLRCFDHEETASEENWFHKSCTLEIELQEDQVKHDKKLSKGT